MKRFALIGAAGYIAPRHMKAIKDNGCNLVASYDPYDGVGIMDSLFPDADFFTEFERFDRYIDLIKRNQSPIDFMSICSPNYLHDAHIRYGLKNGCDVICEKPLVLNTWNLDALKEIEEETRKKVYTILQLRLHPTIIALREKIKNGPKNAIYDVDLSYITARGKWYHHSWKGDIAKSGGIASNIGIHFFDMLVWIFGDFENLKVHSSNNETVLGELILQQARIKWKLSIDYNQIPTEIQKTGKRTYRSLTIYGTEIEFSEGFTELHTDSYNQILQGNGFGLSECSSAIAIVSLIRKFN
jgi:UDP-N-acetyl-2-amino-2-deoxyglucuronate dehydrogenase